MPGYILNPTIAKRVQKQNFSTSPYHCYICGKAFKSDACPHNVQQQAWAVEEVKKVRLLYIMAPQCPSD